MTARLRRVIRWAAVLISTITLAACGASLTRTDAAEIDGAEAAGAEAAITSIEDQVGGRLGVALLSGEAGMILGHRKAERFAMCSTFKAPLGAAVLAEVEAGRLRLKEPIAISRNDLVPYAPAIEQRLKAGEVSMPLDALIAAAMQASDNSAANLLLQRIGGPEGFTRFARERGDTVTRLDRLEPELNENRPGDPRDTTSPEAMARLMREVLLGDALREGSRALLIQNMIATETGLRRIRAGLPEGWLAGDKTGTCGSAYNDVSMFWDDAGMPYFLSVYLDRPSAQGVEAEAALAAVARVASGYIRAR